MQPAPTEEAATSGRLPDGRLRIVTPRWATPLLGPARYKGAWGGRGSGKSHFFAELAIDYSVSFPGLRVVCVREIQNTLRQSVKRLIEDKIIALGVQSSFNVGSTEIGTPGGGIIIFTGMQNHTAESIKSLEGFDILWFEEAQSASAFSLGLLRPTMRKDTAEIWASWNPRNADDPFDALLRGEHPPPRSKVVKVNYTENKWFPRVLREEMEYDKRRDPDRYAHVWLGEYQRKSQARVFRNWTVDDFETPADARFMFGADWGFAVDPTVLIRCFIKGRTLFVDHEVWKIGCEVDFTPALFAGYDTRDPPRWRNPYGWPGIPGALKWPLRADSANPQIISYMRRHGFDNITKSIKGPGSVEEGVEFLKSYDIVVHSRCPHVADELATYSYEIDKRTEEVLPVLADKKNHTIDSLRYAVEPTRHAPAKPVFATYGSVVAR
jgi:phage terminase large subunit